MEDVNLEVRQFIGGDYGLFVNRYLTADGDADHVRLELQKWAKRCPIGTQEQMERLQNLVNRP